MSKPIFSLEEAEVEVGGLILISSAVEVGDRVDVGCGWVATITKAGMECDCNRGAMCSKHTQERM